MQKLLGSLLFCSLGLFGCNETHEGTEDAATVEDSGLMCVPCEDAIQLRIQGVTNPDDIVVDGVDLTCFDSGTFIYCGIRDLLPGEYSLTIGAAGFAPETLFFSLGEPTTIGGCTCPSTFTRLITLRPI